MTALINMTAHPCEQVVARDRGRAVRRIACRARWKLDGTVPVDGQAQTLTLCDRFSSQGQLLEASDLGPRRAGTTVLVTGRIVSSHPERTEGVQATVRVAGASFEALAYPPRVWVANGTGFEARPTGWFEPVAPSFTAAFGGPDLDANPVGLGALSEGQRPDGQRLPRVEAPEAPLLNPFERPAPRAIGLIAPGWSPRRQLAGTYDERWLRTRAPELPDDASARFFDPGSFVVEPKLRGGEAVNVRNFEVPGLRSFVVPRVLIRFILDRRSTRPEVDELHIDLERGTLELLLRAELPWNGVGAEPVFVRELGLARKAS